MRAGNIATEGDGHVQVQWLDFGRKVFSEIVPSTPTAPCVIIGPVVIQNLVVVIQSRSMMRSNGQVLC